MLSLRGFVPSFWCFALAKAGLWRRCRACVVSPSHACRGPGDIDICRAPPSTADAAGYVETSGPAPASGKTAAAYNKMGSDDTNKDPPAAEGRQHPEPVSVSDLPPLEPIPAPAEGNDQAGPTRDEVLRQALVNFMAEADDDMIYIAAAELPLSQLSRLMILLSEVNQDNYYALANLRHYNIEETVAVLAAHPDRSDPAPGSGQYRPLGARSMPEGPRLPDREGAAAIEENLARPAASFPQARGPPRLP